MSEWLGPVALLVGVVLGVCLRLESRNVLRRVPGSDPDEHARRVARAEKDHRRLELASVSAKTDYIEFGGDATRNEFDRDCGMRCRHARKLAGEMGRRGWIVCTNPIGPRKGLLTYERQAGKVCFEAAPSAETPFDPRDF